MPVLEARGIVKTLGAGRAQLRILGGVDLEIDAGEVVAVLGRSGSRPGTSTRRTAPPCSRCCATCAGARW